MKRNTLSTVVSILSTVNFEGKDALMAELNAELNKGAEERAAKAAMYSAAHEVVMGILSKASEPMTAADIMGAGEDSLPEDFSINNLTYAFRVLWADEVVKTEGRVNLYAIRA